MEEMCSSRNLNGVGCGYFQTQ